MKNLSNLGTKTLAVITLSALLFATQSAMAVDEAEEVIPAASSHMTTPHEHKLGNAEDGTDPANDKTAAASNEDDHHDVKSLDDTTQ